MAAAPMEGHHAIACDELADRDDGAVYLRMLYHKLVNLTVGFKVKDFNLPFIRDGGPICCLVAEACALALAHSNSVPREFNLAVGHIGL